MNELFHAVSERLKMIFTAHAALELEAELILCHAQRKAALLKQAAHLEQEGMADLAAELRRHTGAMDLCPHDDKPALAAPMPSASSDVQIASPASGTPDAPPSTSRKKR
jgi:hypothetical protein